LAGGVGFGLTLYRAGEVDMRAGHYRALPVGAYVEDLSGDGALRWFGILGEAATARKEHQA
jgi:hypothetical protein